jgi:RNA polymerase sigma-70 factor (ECF subfamily)
MMMLDVNGRLRLREPDRKRRFELLALPHLDAAFNLARWLAGNSADAEDVVQEAYLRAYRYFDAWQGRNFRVWLLAIVRNSFFTWVRENRSGRLVFQPEPAGDTADEQIWSMAPPDPETLLLLRLDSQALSRLMQRLPVEYREVLLLREVEDLSYKDIAAISRVPIGTVMSRLARARAALRRLWLAETAAEAGDAL